MMTEWQSPDTAPTAAERILLKLLAASCGSRESVLFEFEGTAAGEIATAGTDTWERVLELATWHKVAPFLFARSRRWEAVEDVPTDFTDGLRMAYLAAVARHARIAAQAGELLAALRRGSVRTLPLKGMWLAERAYEDGACRPMNDLDVIVPRGQFTTAQRILTELGYRTDEVVGAANFGKHCHYERGEAELTVELHWRVWSLPDREVEETRHAALWDALVPGELHGVTVETLPWEAWLVFMAQHTLGHRLAVPLRAYLDLAVICEHAGEALDVEEVDRQAKTWGIPGGMRFVTRLAADIFGERPFEHSRELLTDGNAERRSAAVLAALRVTSGSARVFPTLSAAMRQSLPRRLWQGVRRVALPAAELRLKYPRLVRRAGLLPAYIWRGIDLARRYGRLLGEENETALGNTADLANFNTREALLKAIEE